MSLVLEILDALDDGHADFVRLRGEIHRANRLKVNFSNPGRDNSLRVTLSRLKKRGLVRNTSGVWEITSEGLEFLKNFGLKICHIPKRLERGPKNMIVIFDIPETKERARAWLRIELKHLGFVMLQKSAWFGPAPLPKEFIKSLRRLNILSCLKFFEAKESDIV